MKRSSNQTKQANRVDQKKSNQKQLKTSGLTFDLALRLFLPKRGRILKYVSEEFCDTDKSSGVYLLVQQTGRQREIVYVGSYQGGVGNRWGHVEKGHIKHFKREEIKKLIRKGHQFLVFAQDEIEMKNQLGHKNTKWINCEGIETALIRSLKDLWNKRGGTRSSGGG